MTVLIVPDKFKGTLSAKAAAKSIARGWRRERPQDSLELLPMSDGGDGFGEVLSDLLGAVKQSVRTVDAAHRPCKANWWWQAESRTAIVDSARVIGLAMLPPGKFHPFALDTFGLGAVLRAAERKGARQILIGIGGSATNDGGFGLARALGWEFRDRSGRRLERWMDLSELTEIRRPACRLVGRVFVAVDVQNRLLGAHGATRVYGPQKGLRPEDFDLAERCLGRLAKVVREQSRRDLARAPGAGAAGGLGFGLAAFAGARWQPGFALFAKHAALTRRLRGADLVITGEGSIDRSTVMGKGVGEIARLCRQLGLPCLGLAGTTSPSREVKRLFTAVNALTDLMTPAQAMANPARWLSSLAACAAREFRLSRA